MGNLRYPIPFLQVCLITHSFSNIIVSENRMALDQFCKRNIKIQFKYVNS